MKSHISIDKLRDGWRVVRHRLTAPNRIDRCKFTIIGSEKYATFPEAARVYEAARKADRPSP